jgi:adenosylmethionine-8-amino-7-oxononanoate aminotransferase
MKVHRVGNRGQLSAIMETDRIAGAVIEPLIQGAAGMKVWPPGTLRELRDWCDAHGIFLILDEVMTGFGRTGTLFACEQEEVVPDFLALAKGLTGGYLPLAATMTTAAVFDAFLNSEGDNSAHEKDNTFYYGHSYTGNPLGCAAALANLRIFEKEHTLDRLQPKIALMTEGLEKLQRLSRVSTTRQCGFIGAVDLCQKDGTPFPRESRAGAAVCKAARKHGLLTRPIGDTVVLMPPLCTTPAQLEQAFSALDAALEILD